MFIVDRHLLIYQKGTDIFFFPEFSDYFYIMLSQKMFRFFTVCDSFVVLFWISGGNLVENVDLVGMLWICAVIGSSRGFVVILYEICEPVSLDLIVELLLEVVFLPVAPLLLIWFLRSLISLVTDYLWSFYIWLNPCWFSGDAMNMCGDKFIARFCCNFIWNLGICFTRFNCWIIVGSCVPNCCSFTAHLIFEKFYISYNRLIFISGWVNFQYRLIPYHSWKNCLKRHWVFPERHC